MTEDYLIDVRSGDMRRLIYKSVDGGSHPQSLAKALNLSQKLSRVISHLGHQAQRHERDPPRRDFGLDGGAFHAAGVFKFWRFR
ncbi:hypothetical protein [uncultured Roseovarius sp.]|uniref:hypothetical protein n=1 Tax=uncultured Roseovarius sp. TaxID=293344 RepID=UPI0026249C33|nr:hypothetical protein [uncultured Roseovarius sp.]